MHYANGRPAQNGDKVIAIAQGPIPIVGILYDAVPNNDFCNGYLAPLNGGSGTYACLCDCLRLDDFKALFPTTRDGLAKLPKYDAAKPAEA